MNTAADGPVDAPGPAHPPLPGLAQAVGLLAADPGLQGMVWRGPAEVLDAAADALRQAVQARQAPWVRVPSHLQDAGWSASLDLAASLAARRPVHRPGVVERARGGVLLLPQAARLSAAALALLEQGLQACSDVVVVALVADGDADADASPPRLLERLALVLSLRGMIDVPPIAWPDRRDAAAAAAGTADPRALADLCEAASALGIAALSAPWLAWRTACAQAALQGRRQPNDDDLALAVRAVLLPRALSLPPPDAADSAAAGQRPSDPGPTDTHAGEPPAGDSPRPPAEPSPPPAAPPDTPAPRAATEPASPMGQPPEPAVAPSDQPAAPPTPPGSGWQRLVDPLRPLLAAELGRAADAARSRPPASGGRGEGGSRPANHGRPGPARRGLPRGRYRLDLAATWRAALPWQALRTAQVATDIQGASTARPGTTAQSSSTGQPATSARPSRIARPASAARPGTTSQPVTNAAPASPPSAPRLQVRRHDLHVRGRTGAPPTTTVFVVDASGSQALHRLAEAKGAVELLLSQCYVRRDRVALIAFSGNGIETLLPPTRALARARGALAALPGGGGTPLAGGLRAARGLSQQVQQRDGQGVRLVLLTDARANLTLDGRPQREAAWQDALAEAPHWRRAGLQGSLIDTAPRPQAAAATLAAALGLRYVALPSARAGDVVAALGA